MSLIKPVDVKLTDLDGVERSYKIGRFPAVEGLEFLVGIPASITTLREKLPTLQPLLVKMMRFVHVEYADNDGNTHEQKLITKELIDAHVPDSETLLRVAVCIMQHNTSFFGRVNQSPLAVLVDKMRAHVPKITQMFQRLSERLSAKN